MKKIYIVLLVLIVSLLLACCAQKTDSVRPLEGPGDLDHPYVIESYEMLKNANQKHDFPFIFSEGIGGSVDGASNMEFFFHITYDDGINDQIMEVSTAAYGNMVQRGFKIKFETGLEDYAVTDAILCSILAVEDMSYDKAEQQYNEMLGGYSGYGYSNIIRLNGYRLYVREEWPGHVLHVISEDNVYLSGSSSEYDSYTVDQLLNSENNGNKVSLNLTVENIIENDDFYILETTIEGENVGVYCEADVFAGCFDTGERIKLYCELSRPRENYDICLKLNYIEE